MRNTTVRAALGLFTLTASAGAWATNGMALEGYGPEAAAMGGASMAYDNGVAAVANNPATLGLMTGESRLDIALGTLGPRINASAGGGAMSADSSAKLFLMPAIGYARRSGPFTYGVGLFGQGGMGTEYAADSFMAAGSGQKVRSELGVGRLIFPVAYEASPGLSRGWLAGLCLGIAGPEDGSVWRSAGRPQHGCVRQPGGGAAGPGWSFLGAG